MQLIAKDSRYKDIDRMQVLDRMQALNEQRQRQPCAKRLQAAAGDVASVCAWDYHDLPAGLPPLLH